MNLNFREVLLGGAEITWNQRVLWFLPILLGALTYIYAAFTSLWTQKISKPTNTSNPNNFKALFGNASTIPWVIFVLIVYFIIYGGVSNINTIVCVLKTYQVDQDRQTLSLGQLIRSSLPYFWRMVGLTFALGMLIIATLIPFFCIFLLFIALTAGKALTGTVDLVIFFVFFLLFEIVFMGLIQQSVAALIVEDKRVTEALGRGWEIFKRYFKSNLLMALALSFTFVIVGGLAIPIQLLARSFSLSFSNFPLNIGLVVGYSILIGIIVGIAQVYTYSTWTLTFLRLTGISGKNSARI